MQWANLFPDFTRNCGTCNMSRLCLKQELCTWHWTHLIDSCCFNNRTRIVGGQWRHKITIYENGLSVYIHIWQMRDVTYASFSRVDINAPVDVPTNDGSIKCHHCNDLLKVNDMRMHVGRHILRKSMAYPHSVSTCE